MSCVLIASCGGKTDAGAALVLDACVAESVVERVGRPNQPLRLRLVNGWRWAGRDVLASAGMPLQTIRVPARREPRRLVFQATQPLTEAPAASLDGSPLQVRQNAEITEVELPASKRLTVGVLTVEFPVDTVLVDSRVRWDQPGQQAQGSGDTLAPGEWARCLPSRGSGGIPPTRVEVPEIESAEVRLFLSQGELWLELQRTASAGWRLPPETDLERAIFVVENVGPGLQDLPTSADRAQSATGRGPEASELSHDSASLEPSAEPPQAVLVYVMDALRAQTAERVETLDDFAVWRDLVAAGVALREHFAVAPNTLPSTKALFTGQVWPQQGGWVLRPDQGATLAENYRDAGFRTAMFSNNPYISADFGVDRGFDHVHGGEIALEDRNDDARQLVDAAERWLDSLPAGEALQPIFLYVHVLQPHNPYRPGSEALRRVTKTSTETIDGKTATLLEVSRGRRTPDAAETQFLRDLYAAQMIEAVEQLARLRDSLERRFGAGRSLTVATSDHGEEILEHDSALHGYTLYDEMTRIPAVLAGAGLEAGTGFVAALTDTTDVHCWLRALAIGERTCRLHALLMGDRAEVSRPVRVFSAAASVKGGIFAIRSSDTKFVFAPQRGSRWGFGSGRGRNWRAESLYDLTRDPGELNDLLAPGASTADHALDLERLRLELELWRLRQSAFLKDGADDEVVDPAVERRLRGLGYVQ